jgi:hypothetical protein
MVLFVAGSLSMGTARNAAAQGFISPFIGYNFGGDAGCPNATNCNDKRVDWGVALGALGSVVGFETEFGYTKDFFGESSAQTSNVLTVMGNFMLAPKFGPIQPYGLAGIGLMRTSLETTGENEDENAGIAIVKKAIQTPLRQIIENSGVEASIVVGKLLEQKSMTYGFDAQAEKYVDLIEAGIVDPTKVVRIALQNASSVAALLITTEAMVADRPAKPAAGGGGGGHGGGMGEMDF